MMMLSMITFMIMMMIMTMINHAHSLCFVGLCNRSISPIYFRVTSSALRYDCRGTSGNPEEYGYIDPLNSPRTDNITRTKLSKTKRVYIFLLDSARHMHYSDVIMIMMASQITSLTVVCLTVYSDADQRKLQSSASLDFLRGIRRSWDISVSEHAADDRGYP